MAEVESSTGVTKESSAAAATDRDESGRAPANEAPSAMPEEAWVEAGRYPCLLSMDVKLEGFTVRHLLRLKAGMVLESTTANVEAVPMVVNRRTIGWAVFEVVGQRLGVRVTELA